MRYTIGSRTLLFIYRYSFILGFSIGVGCCSGLRSCRKPATVPLLKEKNEHKGGHKRKINSLNDFKPFRKKIKKIIKTAKVKEDAQAIVLLHGLSRISYDFETMKAVLRQKFPYATIVALKSVDKDPGKKGNFLYMPPSVMLSIKTQAELAYEEIKTLIGRDKHVVLVGHSQGGLRAFTLIKEYGRALKREVGITIDQLITIGTPWTGAPVMDHLKDPKWVTKKLDQEKDTLEKIQKGYRRDLCKHIFKNYAGIAEKIPGLARYLYNNTNGFKERKKRMSGADDLSPGSDFMRYVTLGIKELGVPITAIAGVLMDFSELFPFPFFITAEALLKLNHTYAELIGGNPKCEHDMLLPASTQLAEGLDKKDFECIKIYGACHGNKVGISVKKGVPACNNKQVIQKVVACIEKTFYSETKIEEDIIEK